MAEEGNANDNWTGDFVNDCAILHHIQIRPVELCILRNKVNELKNNPWDGLKTVFVCSIKQLFETADKMYINPPHRFTVYAMGIVLGYTLRMFKDIKLTKSQLKVGWYCSTASLLLAFFGPAPMGDIDYEFNSIHAAHYAAFAPIAWCIFFGWIIFVAQLGHKS